jgi:AcrR family transcriptional regulator
MATDTREALLSAAKQLVVERGYAGATVRELAAAADANIAAVNYHFGTREKLLNAAILELFAEWVERVGENWPSDPDAEPLQQLAARARPMIKGIPAMQPFFAAGMEALLQSRRSPELHEQMVAHYANLRRIAMQGMMSTERGREMPPRALEVVASFMLAVADGLQVQALVDPDAIPTGDELAGLYEALAAAARAAVPPSAATDDDEEP